MEEKLIDIQKLSEMTMISTKTLRKMLKDDASFPQSYQPWASPYTLALQ
jgi:predicted DNA-binding transcriptional regulator AlpA